MRELKVITSSRIRRKLISRSAPTIPICIVRKVAASRPKTPPGRKNHPSVHSAGISPRVIEVQSAAQMQRLI